MTEDTTITTKPDPENGPANGDSHLAGISIRAWLALILVFAVCFKSMLSQTVEEPLYTLVVMAVSFYFGQTNRKQPAVTT